MTHLVDGSPTVPALHKHDEPKAGQSIKENLAALIENASTAADAQFALFRLALIKGVMAVVLAVPMLLALAALGVYGFVLLDRAADFALSNPDFPLWLSPVVRGGVYFLLTAIVVVPAMKNAFTAAHSDGV